MIATPTATDLLVAGDGESFSGTTTKDGGIQSPASTSTAVIVGDKGNPVKATSVVSKKTDDNIGISSDDDDDSNSSGEDEVTTKKGTAAATKEESESDDEESESDEKGSDDDDSEESGSNEESSDDDEPSSSSAKGVAAAPTKKDAVKDGVAASEETEKSTSGAAIENSITVAEEAVVAKQDESNANSGKSNSSSISCHESSVVDVDSDDLNIDDAKNNENDNSNERNDHVKDVSDDKDNLVAVENNKEDNLVATSTDESSDVCEENTNIDQESSTTSKLQEAANTKTETTTTQESSSNNIVNDDASVVPDAADAVPVEVPVDDVTADAIPDTIDAITADANVVPGDKEDHVTADDIKADAYAVNDVITDVAVGASKVDDVTNDTVVTADDDTNGVPANIIPADTDDVSVEAVLNDTEYVTADADAVTTYSDAHDISADYVASYVPSDATTHVTTAADVTSEARSSDDVENQKVPKEQLETLSPSKRNQQLATVPSSVSTITSAPNVVFKTAPIINDSNSTAVRSSNSNLVSTKNPINTSNNCSNTTNRSAADIASSINKNRLLLDSCRTIVSVIIANATSSNNDYHNHPHHHGAHHHNNTPSPSSIAISQSFAQSSGVGNRPGSIGGTSGGGSINNNGPNNGGLNPSSSHSQHSQHGQQHYHHMLNNIKSRFHHEFTDEMLFGPLTNLYRELGASHTELQAYISELQQEQTSGNRTSNNAASSTPTETIARNTAEPSSTPPNASASSTKSSVDSNSGRQRFIKCLCLAVTDKHIGPVVTCAVLQELYRLVQLNAVGSCCSGSGFDQATNIFELHYLSTAASHCAYNESSSSSNGSSVAVVGTSNDTDNNSNHISTTTCNTKSTANSTTTASDGITSKSSALPPPPPPPPPTGSYSRRSVTTKHNNIISNSNAKGESNCDGRSGSRGRAHSQSASIGGSCSIVGSTQSDHQPHRPPRSERRRVAHSLASSFSNLQLSNHEEEKLVHQLVQLCALLTQRILVVATTTTTTLATHCPKPIDIKLLLGLFGTCWHIRFSMPPPNRPISVLLLSSAWCACRDIFTSLFQYGICRGSAIDKIVSVLNSNTGMDNENAAITLTMMQNRGFSVNSTNHVVQALELAIIAIHASVDNQNDESNNPSNASWCTALAKSILVHVCGGGSANTCSIIDGPTKTVNDQAVLRASCNVMGALFRHFPEAVKCETEVFVQSVLLPRLQSGEDEEREIVLTCLVYEYCCAWLSIYVNFDCDGGCTNLLEAILRSLGRAACCSQERRLLSVGLINGSERSETSEKLHDSTTGRSSGDRLMSSPSVPNASTVTYLHQLAYVGIETILNGLEMRMNTIITPSSTVCDGSTGTLKANVDDCSLTIDQSIGQVQCKGHGTSERQLRQRKQTKTSLARIVKLFNQENPDKGDWIDLAQKEGYIRNSEDTNGIAKILKIAPGWDKCRVGIYLSRGPPDQYPFHELVRNAFSAMNDYSGLSFAAALRKYLSKFRLPGEAQCIDRLMESFSKELYRQQSSASVFKDADAVYVLAFSTIMLNTDLHNPTIREDERMTLDQFIKNNRGINSGGDIPTGFLSNLYNEIKEYELEVHKEPIELSRLSSEGWSSEKLTESIESKRKTVLPVTHLEMVPDKNSPHQGFQDKEIFLVFVRSCIKSFAITYRTTWEDSTIVRLLNNFQRIVDVAAHFDCDTVVDDVAKMLLPLGRDYIRNCIKLEQRQQLSIEAASNSARAMDRLDSVSDDEFANEEDTEKSLPTDMLYSSISRKNGDIHGSAANRGLLALDKSCLIFRQNSNRISDAWTIFIECLASLRDLNALPSALAELDDFADGNGNVLPQSEFSIASKSRFEEQQRMAVEKGPGKGKGWFRSLFRKGRNGVPEVPAGEDKTPAEKPIPSVYAKVLLAVAEATNVEEIVQVGSAQFSDNTIRGLLSDLEGYPFDDDAIAEQHAIFSLELAARALLSSRERASTMLPIFVTTFEGVLCQVDVNGDDVKSPFTIERIVVTILRACIHLYEEESVRPHLRSALQLITMTLPKSYVEEISNRMSCGLAIILRSSYQHFINCEWTFMGDTLDALANHDASRLFVFDGIASTLEYAIPSSDHSDRPESDTDRGDTDSCKNGPLLSIEASTVLTRIISRFVLGYYHSDTSLIVPAMLCLEKIYRHKVSMMYQQEEQQEAYGYYPSTYIPDLEVWQNLAVAIYSVCRSSDANASSDGTECFERVIVQSHLSGIPDDKIMAVLFLMVSKQAPAVSVISRCNTFTLIGRVLIRVVPHLNYDVRETREDMEDLVTQIAGLARQNLVRNRGQLFHITLKQISRISDQLVSTKFGGDAQFNTYASGVLHSVLEGAGHYSGGTPTTTGSAEEAEDVSEISDSVVGGTDEDEPGAVM